MSTSEKIAELEGRQVEISRELGGYRAQEHVYRFARQWGWLAPAIDGIYDREIKPRLKQLEAEEVQVTTRLAMFREQAAERDAAAKDADQTPPADPPAGKGAVKDEATGKPGRLGLPPGNGHVSEGAPVKP